MSLLWQFGQQQKTYKNHKRSKHISKRRSENQQATGAVKNSVTYIHKSDKDKRQQPNNNANNKSKPYPYSKYKGEVSPFDSRFSCRTRIIQI